ncbi:MAG TPA: hypothetical protein PKZ49_03545 [Nitrosomonas sp.]|nr:hypothetical protein [Nitrosomonas sp.]
MKQSSLKKAAIFISTFILIGQVNIASSHQLNNSLTAADAVDHFLVTCGERGNHHLFVQIDDLSVVDSRQFNVLVAKDKVISSATNEDGKSSAVLRVAGGTGTYHVYVSQTRGGEKAANYQLLYHCEDVDNDHLETSIFTKINQP